MLPITLRRLTEVYVYIYKYEHSYNSEVFCIEIGLHNI